MMRLTKLLALFSFASAAFALAGCGRSDLLSYDQAFIDGGTGTDARPDTRPQHDARPDSPSTSCTTSANCASTPATPFCELPQGVCVACLTNPDTCPVGEVCSPTTHTCQPLPGGCTSNAQCPASKPICDTADGECVGCLLSSDCPSGDICENFECVPSCGGGQACTNGLSCCEGGCIDTVNDPDNCGFCNNVCPPGESCLGSACQPPTGCEGGGCIPGDSCCGDICANLQTSNAFCGNCETACAPDESCVNGVCEGITTCVCAVGESCCGAICTSLESDPNNCGGCNVQCGPDTECEGGQCIVIMMGCNGGPSCVGDQSCCQAGCTDVETDPNNCSQCGFACPAGNTCVQGNCTPPASCNGGPLCTGLEQCCKSGCADIDTDPNNCGGCGNPCPPKFTCAAGMCTPPASCNGGPVCTGVQQCCPTGCSNVDTDPQNCGQCGTICGPGSTCVGGTCQTPPTCNGGPLCTNGEQCCAAGCTNTQTDPKNCSQCGLACPVGDTCVGGVCTQPTSCNGGPACPVGDTCCPSGCLDVTSDPKNCGGCGVVCGGGDMCIDSTCTNSEGAFNPTVSPTYLTPGVHAYSSINIPAGVTVYVGGAGGTSGTLSLSATGSVVVAGIIDVSGGPGTQNTITSQNTQSGEAGAGGYTGEPYQSAAGSAACSFVAGNGGQLGDAIMGTPGSCFVASTTTCINENAQNALLFTVPVAAYGGGAGVFTGYRAYGGGGGGPAGGAPGGLGAAYPGEGDCSGVSGGGGATSGAGGAGPGPYKGTAGVIGQTQCAGLNPGVPPAYVGGGGGGGIGAAAAADHPVTTTFQTGSAGGGGSADYLNRPVFGGTSGGGGGGGALKLSAGTTMSITGQLRANGGVGGDAVIGIGSDAMCDPQPGAAGGGGSGGVIYLASPTLTVAAGAVITAAGGAGGEGSEFATGGGGGKGGVGRIRLSVSAPSCAALAGTFTPGLPAGCAAGAATAGVTYIGVFPN